MDCNFDEDKNLKILIEKLKLSGFPILMFCRLRLISLLFINLLFLSRFLTEGGDENRQNLLTNVVDHGNLQISLKSATQEMSGWVDLKS